MSSCNENMSYFLSFKSDISFIYTSDKHFTLIWNSKQVSELVKMLLQAFSDTPNRKYRNIYKKKQKALQTL